MPIEYAQLRYKPPALQVCPKCKSEFEHFMRGMVQSYLRRLFKMKYCAVICYSCKERVGWEKP